MKTLKQIIAEAKKSKYKVKKAYSMNSRGREIPIYNVVDAEDDYVYDTFSLLRDAKAWIKRAEEREKKQ